MNQRNVSELTKQLERSEDTVMRLQRVLEETRSKLRHLQQAPPTQPSMQDQILTQKRIECLETLCCLSVEVKEENDKVIYQCTVGDGELLGE